MASTPPARPPPQWDLVEAFLGTLDPSSPPTKEEWTYFRTGQESGDARKRLDQVALQWQNYYETSVEGMKAELIRRGIYSSNLDTRGKMIDRLRRDDAAAEAFEKVVSHHTGIATRANL